jgi:hypothetical protein
MAEDPVALPTEEELRQLPRWALVAYAARSARRVQPLFTPGPPGGDADALEKAIEAAESAARTGRVEGLFDATLERVTVLSRVSGTDNPAARAAARAAASALEAAVKANAYDADAVAVAARRASEAVAAASNAEATTGAAAAMTAAGVFAAASARADLERFVAMAQRDGWTDLTPVHVDWPLWSGSEPDWWPKAAVEARRIDTVSGATAVDRTKLPSPEELKSLPRWALVAYAARCARRAEPIFSNRKHDGTRDDQLDRVIGIAEASASAGKSTDEQARYSESISLLGHTHSSLRVSELGENWKLAAKQTQGEEAAVWSASFAYHAAIGFEKNVGFFQAVGSAASNSVKAAEHLLGAGLAIWAARLDFDHLRTTAREEKWTDDTPVHVSRIGPLWWGNEPDWWPKTERERRRIKLDIAVPAGMPEEEAQALISRVILALSRRHQELGGSGLVLDTLHVESPSAVPAGGGQ